jgi:hypothetical protein
VLELSSTEGLVAHNAASDLEAGVSIDVPDVRSWKSKSSIHFEGQANDVLTASSLSGGVVTSQARVKHGRALLFTAAFTGSMEDRAYRVDVLLNGVHKGAAVNVPSGLDGAKQTSVMGPPQPLASRSYDYLSDFIIQPNGACQWGFSFEAASGYPITLPNGLKVMGNEIRLTEQVEPAGAYPYTSFDGLVFQGEFVELAFASEIVE